MPSLNKKKSYFFYQWTYLQIEVALHRWQGIKNYIVREGEEMEWMRVNRYTDTTATIIRPHRFNIFFLT